MHLINDKNRFTSPTPDTDKTLIEQADGTMLKVTHRGTTTLRHESCKELTLEDVDLVPGLSETLISVRSLNDKGYCVTFTPDGGEIRKGEERWSLARGGGAWTFPKAQDKVALTARNPNEGPRNDPLKVNWQDLYEKLGHASEKKLRSLEKTGLVKLTGKCETDKCEPCLLCKPRLTDIPSAATRSGEVVVQVDGMPWKGGFRGQLGAIVFLHRVNKMVHAYPYRHK